MRARLLSLLLRPTPPPVALGLVIAAVLVAAETVVLFPLEGIPRETSRGVVYLLGVLIVSIVWGLKLGMATALASAVAFNFFQFEPRGQLHMTTGEDLEQLLMFTAAAVIAGGLVNLARSRAVEAVERRREADLAAELARLMLGAGDLHGVLRAASHQFARRFALPFATIELDAVAGDERRTAIRLHDGTMPVGTLLVPANLPERTLTRIRQRMVPSLASLLHAALDREAMTNSLRLVMEEQAALRRVATLVAHGAPPTEVFCAVAAELREILGQYTTAVVRYEPDGTISRVAGRDERGGELPPLSHLSLEESSIAAAVKRTARAARIDRYHAAGSLAVHLQTLGIRSALGVPIKLQGDLWGVAVIASSEPRPIPSEAEARLADFTELVATAIANAEHLGQLTASRARIVAAADDARRRLERDLHDGAQQRLISLGLRLRMTEASIPPELGLVRNDLSQTVEGLTGVFEDLRAISRGVHPAIMSKGGLGPALKSLAGRSAIPVEFTLDIERRLPDYAEVAAYYIVSEALTNAVKHARATVVNVDVDAGDATLKVSVRDNGVGGATCNKGSGLIGLQDRVEALGGHMDIVSPAGCGTALLAKIPTSEA